MESMIWSLLFELVNAIYKEPKLGFLIVAFLFGVPSYIIYLIDLLKGHTTSHPVTWLIWFITQTIATVGIWIGEGGYGAVYYVFYSFTIFTIFVITTYKYGMKGVNKKDIMCLIICLCAICIWIIFDTPLLGVIIVTIVDVYGYDPTYRKSYKHPWDESLLGWGLAIPNVFFTTLAMNQYNWLTLTYPVAIILASAALIILCLVRRQRVAKPKFQSEQ